MKFRLITTLLALLSATLIRAAGVGDLRLPDAAMFDLLALAYKSEITRVGTMMYAKDLSPASYPASRSSIRSRLPDCADVAVPGSPRAWPRER